MSLKSAGQFCCSGPSFADLDWALPASLVSCRFNGAGELVKDDFIHMRGGRLAVGWGLRYLRVYTCALKGMKNRDHPQGKDVTCHVTGLPGGHSGQM